MKPESRIKVKRFFVILTIVAMVMATGIPAFAEEGSQPEKPDYESSEKDVPNVDLPEYSSETDSEPVESEKIQSEQEEKVESTPQNDETNETDDNQTAIFLNGSGGDDSKDGFTRENAVKTFEKAKEIAGKNKEIEKIFITGAVSVKGDITLKGTSAIIMRDPDFGGYLFYPSSGTTFHDITIDGNKDNVSQTLNSVASLIRITGKDVSIESGTVLQNNRARTSSNSTPSSGGALSIDGGEVDMTGGVISNNEANWGGGVYVNSATFNMSGGVIENNHAVDKNGTPEYGCGGGIVSWNGSFTESHIIISKDALITGNIADERGGGISAGTYNASNSKINLKMTGGTISENTAGSAGGGIFVQAGFDGKKYNLSYAEATLSGGKIINNRITAEGYGNNAFGGGGIYVNGYPENYGDEWGLTNGILYLKNAVISDNTADLEGGGVAACPVSKTYIYMKNGVAIYDNHGSKARDVYILASNEYGIHSGNSEYYISPIMLGGVPYHWKDENGNEIPLNKLSGKLNAAQKEELSLHTDASGDETTEKLASLYISENHSATRGAGVGSNGTLIFGERELTNIDVTKNWFNVSSEEMPDSIEIELYSKLKGSDDEPVLIGYETIRPDKDGKWHIQFNKLPKTDSEGNQYIYTVKEKADDKYLATVDGNQDDGFIVTNYPLTSLNLEKQWIGDEAAESVKVNICANGTKIKTVELKKSEGWKSSVDGLKKYDESGKLIEYTVKEETVPGYETLISGNAEEGFVIRNEELTSIELTKKWVGEAAKNSINVDILANGEKVKTVLLKKSEGWKLKVEGLKKYDESGNLIEYTVKEEEIPGYESSITGNAGSGFIISNEELTSIDFTKKWVGEAAQDSVKVDILANGETVKKVELKKSEDWKFKVEGLKKYDQSGNLIEYTIKEEEIPGYETSISGNAEEGFVITNEELSSIDLTKKWVGEAAQDSVKVDILANGEKVKTVELKKSEDWKLKVEGLNKYDESGRLIEYTVKEETIPGYETSVKGNQSEGLVITNEELSSIDLTKKWVGEAAQDSVKVDIMANGEKVKTVELKKSEDWKLKVEGLKKYDQSGKLIEYTVMEEAVTGYESSITGDQNDGYVIQNTQLTSVNVNKTWKGYSKDKHEIKVYLVKNGTLTDQYIILNNDNDWKGSFDNLIAVDEKNGKKILYTVWEEGEKDGKLIIDGDKFMVEYDGTEIVNTYIPPEPPVTPPEEPKPPTNKINLPDTGDYSKTSLYILTIVSAFILILVLVKKKTNK